MNLHLVAGARPNYVKIAALVKALKRYKKKHPRSSLLYRLINTGQHYDYIMSKKFFSDLDIPKPFVDLDVGSSSHADQTARIMQAYEKVVLKDRPSLVVVVGDVNSTMACSLVAAKMRIPVAHVEAGLRSFDRDMPEEINRLVTDSISDYLFTSCRDADRNLSREGVSKKKIFFVGNVMVDTLLTHLPKAKKLNVLAKQNLKKPYAFLTLHRPSNVDKESDFLEILKAIEVIQKRMPVVFPVHPRTAAQLNKGKIAERIKGMPQFRIIPPLGYLDFMSLMMNADMALTDSGGVQEETAVLGVPCLTLRRNTERPVTIDEGTNQLAGTKSRRIIRLALDILDGRKKRRFKKPSLWDGKAAERIVAILARKFHF